MLDRRFRLVARVRRVGPAAPHQPFGPPRPATQTGGTATMCDDQERRAWTNSERGSWCLRCERWLLRAAASAGGSLAGSAAASRIVTIRTPPAHRFSPFLLCAPSDLGAAYGTAKSGVGIASMGVMNHEAVMKNIIPVVMAGVLGIYGLIIAVILIQGVKPDKYSAFTGFAHLAAGLSCGLSGLGAGLAIGIVGDAGVRANGIQPKLFVPMVLILIFAEALGLYGLIVGIILSQQTQDCTMPKLA